MAKVIVEYDTVDKVTTVSIDGEAQLDVQRIEFWYGVSLDGDPVGHMRMVRHTRDKENDMDESTVVFAKNKSHAELIQQVRPKSRRSVGLLDKVLRNLQANNE